MSLVAAHVSYGMMSPVADAFCCVCMVVCMAVCMWLCVWLCVRGPSVCGCVFLGWPLPATGQGGFVVQPSVMELLARTFLNNVSATDRRGSCTSTSACKDVRVAASASTVLCWLQCR